MNKKTIYFAGIIGNILEVYDLCIYGFFATVIGAIFLPVSSDWVALLKVYLILLVGYIARPLGALCFGLLGDQYGRRAALTLSVLLMAVGTTLVGLLPSYQQIGIFAPILLVILRLAQGISVGGEYTGSLIYMMEESKFQRRGFIGSLATMGSNVGILMASGVSLLVIHGFSKGGLLAIGWRIPFLVASLGGIVGFILRWKLPKPEKPKDNTSTLSSLYLIKDKIKYLLLIILLSWPGVVVTYLIFIFNPTMWQKQAGLSDIASLEIVSLSILMDICILPFAGKLSDKYGRKHILLIATILLIIVLPFCYLEKTLSSPFMIIIMQCCVAIPAAMYFASAPLLIVEMLPKRIRYLYAALGYNLSACFLGGSTPTIAALIVSRTHNLLVLSLYPIGCLLLLLLFFRFIPETACVNLNQSILDATLK